MFGKLAHQLVNFSFSANVNTASMLNSDSFILSAVGLVFCLIMIAFGHLMIWTLAIISAGLHGLRLQYVEFMAKFFDGGGIEFEPLAIKRKKTVSTNA